MIAHPFPSPGTALFLAELPGHGPHHRLPAVEMRERMRALARRAARFDEPEREDYGAVRYERGRPAPPAGTGRHGRIRGSSVGSV
ncbi:MULTISPECIES: hypothetical protein [unclassified Saccharopolyspora]|uniref:hypothetical protein n=1 Tax=unclassified Saccharopolyspora TaxID=2646250 RepID=UPI001CD6E79B|nr:MULTISPECIES: hypothetical protein [unclassified Saccharopolyspora]MCA1184879.1 hypothetical protein [Saccharopolyspora sp. 6T]MCA1283073.1 hypothetical protein [Saccharopolyspora sp. 7B]